MRQQGEPSVEDILDSIKKVIARDSKVASIAPRASRPVAVEEPEDESDVLDLGASAQFMDSAEDEEQDDRHAPSLLGEDARHSMRESLAALAMISQPGHAPQIVRQGETSLEGLARELLRPALAEWLDKNLPPMVEQMVADEIAKIVGKKG
jgi:cell pole-organizing protein PopZ